MKDRGSVEQYVGWAALGLGGALAAAVGRSVVVAVPDLLEGSLSVVEALIGPLFSVYYIASVIGIDCPSYGGAILGGSVLGGLLGGWGFTTLFRRRGRLGAIIGGALVAAASAVVFSSLSC